MLLATTKVTTGREQLVNGLTDTAGFEPGDIIAFSGNSLISDLINVATYAIPRWGISHVGIMGEASDGRLLLFESTTLDSLPCEILGRPFDGTQAHVLEDVIQRYEGRIWHFPLCRSLYENERKRLNEFLLETISVPYDQMGAFRSAGAGLSWIESLFRDQDLSTIFCSEWCCAAHVNIGIFRTDNVSRWNPNRFVRAERKQNILLKPRRLK
jgi:hypothetical protein